MRGEGSQITIGDLHGNAMKLVFMLVKHGIATNINANDYATLVAIYKTPIASLNKKLLCKFNQILASIKFNSDSTIRLIGDELADRGNNDYFTLKILEKLNEYSVPVEIIVSNHSIEFIEAYEKQAHFHAPMLDYSFAQSIEKLQTLVENGVVTRKEILEITKKAYKPTLRAISYSLSKENNEITIYSHAGIGLNTINNLAKTLELTFDDKTAANLAQSIDKINEQFQKHVQNNTVNTLYTRGKLLEAYTDFPDLTDAPFEFILWNRLYDHIHRPAVHSGYTIHFVHGHDATDPNNDICNLDNQLGKSEGLNQGLYTVFISYNSIAALAEKSRGIEKVTDAQQDHRKETTPTVITPTEWEQNFLLQLEKINQKELDLRSRGCIIAANCALTLHNSLKGKYDQLVQGAINNQQFRDSCINDITQARPVLEKYRGLKQILGNLALAVVGLGVFYCVAVCIHKKVTGNFFFFKTNSASKLDKLDQAINSIVILPKNNGC